MYLYNPAIIRDNKYASVYYLAKKINLPIMQENKGYIFSAGDHKAFWLMAI